jgi:hypothetical protein
MSINHELIPKRRFKEFENADAWEQRKFGDIGTVVMCKRIFKEETSENGDVPFYKIGTFGGEPDAYITRELFEKYKSMYPYPQKGDILISASGSIGRTVEYTGKDEYFQDSNIVWLQHNKNIDNSFLKVLYSVVQWSFEGSTIKRLYNDNFLKTKIVIPNIKEQSLIGEYFENLDNLITLHQRKLSKLRILKSAYLSEIIPEEGKLNPKRRFPGFTEDWEKKKISDMFKVTRGQVLSMSLTSPIKDETNKYPVYSSQTKNDGLMGYYSEYLFDTAITWTTDGANAGTVNFRKGKFFSTNVNGVLLSNDGYCNKAVSEILNLVTYKYVSKVGNPKLMNNVMEEIIISVPKDKNEMKIISDFLMTFDKRIIYLEEKIKKLEDLKRSYLNEMFV